MTQFQPTLPARGATQSITSRTCRLQFQPTLPARGATTQTRPPQPGQIYFNPRSPHGERRSNSARTASPTYFNPRSPHGERPPLYAVSGGIDKISTHAPRTGSDSSRRWCWMRRTDFNPRSPHGERPPSHLRGTAVGIGFQPTLPARGATDALALLKHIEAISTHAPRTGSDRPAFRSGARPSHFNPRSPHGERLIP